MTSVESSQSQLRARFLPRALAWSLAIHLLCFGVWKCGQSRGWWQELAAPRWMQALTKKLLTPMTVKVRPPQPKPLPPPLIFVDTDPAQAVKEPPKNAKYYSANNSVAANQEIKQPSDVPTITGHQDKVLKATDAANSKAQPLQPAPKADEKEQPERAASQARPRATATPGDLAMSKPAPKSQANDGKADGDTGAAEEAQPEHHRPRTIQEALQQRGLVGQKVRQAGGVNEIRHESFAAMATSYGDYDREFIAAVQTRWDQLLKNPRATPPGRVVVEFQLLPTGRVTGVKVVENTVDELSGFICMQAISDPAPYKPWPRQMQLDIGADHRDVRFTFFYENE
ncbi:MAG TPA: hypothetical protein VHB20_19530 [Verrucomicrobiae bacterium]|jgi:outer membrane biosynthesis protein TonB|nr:hypothetical protein [Verrucomicrobiae bacterium]